MNGRLGGLRNSEWILAGYFAYTGILAFALPLQAGQRFKILLSGAFAAAVYALLLWGRRRWDDPRWIAVARDWAPLGFAILCYRQAGWFARTPYNHIFERTWIVWDRVLLNQCGLKAAIEAAGPVLPAILELSYLLVYAFPVFLMTMLYVNGRRKHADEFLVIYLLGLFLSYAQFPFWPSEPPRTVYAGQDLPAFTSVFRTLALWLLGRQGIHTSVFPSAHVSGAFAGAFALRRIVMDQVWLRRGVLAYAILVAIATVYGRYHYAADAIAGFAVAVVADAIGARVIGGD